jgi:hypothetical protein
LVCVSLMGSKFLANPVLFDVCICGYSLDIS